MRWLVLVLVGCGDGVSADCRDLCNELVGACAYDAYPSVTSCLQGCAWDEEQGHDVAGLASCVTAAGCDTFEIVECEHDAE